MSDKVTMEWVVKKRPEKVFFDHNQNVRGKTLSGAYTVRAVPGAPVSMPFDWSELRTLYPTDFDLSTTPDRLSTRGDTWSEIFDVRQVLG
jgi:bifunctional non-homologous end joining protein LigD